VSDLLHPVVAIPARDEEALLPRLIAALGRQTVLGHLPGLLEVIIVLNNTTDRSLEAARAASASSPRLRVTLDDMTFPPDSAHVGSARRRAMNLAADAQPSGVILTTDADAVPTDTWIEANLNALGAGNDIVGGRIVGDPDEEALLGQGFLRRARLHSQYGDLRDELAAIIDPLDHDPWPRHHDHTGGSLAVRTSVYRQVGGMEAVPFREDLAFVSKVRAAGYLLSHPLEVTVAVSARTTGRAQGGMADCLSAWVRHEAEGTPVLFESPVAVEERLRRRRALRDIAGASPAAVRRTLRALQIDASVSCPNRQSIAALVERYSSDDPDAPATVPALAAISGLADRITLLRGIADAA
jgi:hypothetical protein